MKLAVSSFENLIPLDNSRVTAITIEDIHFYAKLVRSFFAECSGDDSEISIFLIDDKEKRVSLESCCELILDPLLIDFSSKRFSNALIGLLKKELINDVEANVEITQKLNEIQDMVVSLLDDFGLPIVVDSAWDASKLVKGLSISIDGDTEMKTQLEILLRFLQVVGDLKISNYYIFVGLRKVLCEDEINIFYKEALQRQIQVICVDQSVDIPTQNEFAFSFHVDKDYDEVIIPMDTTEVNQLFSLF